jgi:Na+/melibiose symporter-like transporter
MFCEESYSAFPTLLSFITKLNYIQLNIKKKSTKIILEKILQKKKTPKNWKKKTI